MKPANVFAAFLCFVLVSTVIVQAARDDEPEGDEENDNASLAWNEVTDVDSSGDNEDVDYNPRELLLTALLSNAHPKVPPPPQFLPVKVQVKMRPLHIDEVCTKTYHIKMAVLESYNWTDPRLAWNESDFDDIKSMPVESTDIWMPDIAVYQSPETSSTSLKPKQYRPIVLSDGSVLYMPRTELLLTCAARTWFNVTADENSTVTDSGSNLTTTTTTTTSGAAANEIGTFACEFDQGPWSYDTSVVDIIPTSAASGLAKTKADKKVITKDGQRSTITTTNNKTAQQQKKQQQKKLKQRQQQRASETMREYSPKDFNATTDLSWFEPNQLYDIKKFEAKRNVMQYPGMGQDALWSSLHYRLVVHVKDTKFQSDGIRNYDGKTLSGPMGPVIVPFVA